jgi:hypothetical protein
MAPLIALRPHRASPAFLGQIADIVGSVFLPAARSAAAQTAPQTHRPPPYVPETVARPTSIYWILYVR